MVFDLGGVLIDWDPRHLYRKLFAGDQAAMEQFLATVCTHEWNRCQDAGRSFAEGARLLKAEHPDKGELIDAYGSRFDEMIAGPISGSVEILAELRDRGIPLYGLTNWSAETYPAALRPLCVSTLVPGNSGLGRGRVNQAGPADFRAADRALRGRAAAHRLYRRCRGERRRRASLRHSRDPFHDTREIAGGAGRARAASVSRHVTCTSVPTRRDYGRASRIMLNGVSAARLTLRNPPEVMTSRSLASPACAPSAAPTSCESEVGTQPIVEPA